MSEDRIYQITPSGFKLLKKPDGISPLQLLIVEVIRQAGRIDREQTLELVGQLWQRYGTPEAALVALKTGSVKVEKVA